MGVSTSRYLRNPTITWDSFVGCGPCQNILQRDWATLGPRLAGKLHIYVGDMDNYYLNSAVELTEEFLESTGDPPYGGEVDYGDGDEHCWNGDHTRGNGFSRLRYIQMFAPRIVERIRESAPPGAVERFGRGAW